MANATMSKDDILEAISSMTVLELSELCRSFQDQVQTSRYSAAPVGRGSGRWWRGCWCGLRPSKSRS